MSLSQTKALGRAADAARRPFRWPALLTPDGRGIAYGGDYNPDQWPESVWDDDIRLMTKAGVNTVALAIFSWDRIQPAEDEWDFAWLDRIIGKLGAAGIAVDLASATAAAPLWLYQAHPEVLPIDRYGHTINPGSRQSWSPTSPVFKDYALEMCRRLAERYGDNPTVTAWHVGNEYGWNNRYDYSDNTLRAFRRWCEREYGTVGALNEAWGTAFWSQAVTSFDQVIIPRHMGGDAMVNPAQQLDFERFGSECLKEFYKAERDAIAAICPDKPITTNFMVSTDQCTMDYADWSDDVDFVSNDHYFHEGESHLDELACSDALMNGLSLGKPWYLMEHSTSAVQWKPLNSRKRGGELVRDALAHVALGADAINFFQWRQSRSGAECFHSAMLPHAGEDSKVFRETCELGGLLRRLSAAGLQGAALRPSRTAILFDADCEWMTRSETLPSMKLSHWHDVRDWYRAFLDVSARADVVPLRADWSDYDTVVLPTMFILSESDAGRVRAFARSGGRVIVGYATGIADEHTHVALGGYPGMLRDMLGVRGEEFNILSGADDGASAGADDAGLGDPGTVTLSNGSVSRLWANVVTSVAPDATVLATYEGADAAAWELDGVPAIVRHPYGEGEAYYIGCDLGRADIARFLRDEFAGIPPEERQGADPSRVPAGPEAESQADARLIRTRRSTDTADFDFVINRSGQTVPVSSVAGETIVAYRCDAAESGSSAYALRPNGILITKTAR